MHHSFITKHTAVTVLSLMVPSENLLLQIGSSPDQVLLAVQTLVAFPMSSEPKKQL